MLLLPLILCLATLMVECSAKSPVVPTRPSVDNMTVIEKWEMLEKKLKGAVNSLIKMALPSFVKASGSLNISSQCMRDSMILIGGIKDIRPWALRMIDASAKVIDGMMDGSMSSFGAYDQCVDTHALNERSRNKDKVLFRGQYCTILIKPPLPPQPQFYNMEDVLDELKNFSGRSTALGEVAKFAQAFYFLSLRLGICVPSGCSLEDINMMLTMVSKNLALEARASSCEVKSKLEISNLMIYVMFAYSLAGFLVLVGTVLDLYSHYYKRIYTHTAVRILIAFSFFTNFKMLVNTDTPYKNLSCLHGIRFISISWVVLGHTYVLVNFQIISGLRAAISFPGDFAFQALINTAYSVDTFFFMGGLLVCYFTIKLVKLEKYPFKVIVYILHRLWRIIPVYGFIIMSVFLIPLYGSGPIWHESIDQQVEACYNNWWTNLLFINNFMAVNQMCIPTSWYMASDVQLYLAALLILFPLIKWPKVGIGLCVLGVIASMAYGGITTYINEFPPTILAVHPDLYAVLEYYAQSFYFTPFIHTGPYCVGLLAGYLLIMKPTLKIPKTVLVVGWSLAICINMSVLYGTWEWNKGVEPTFWDTMFYSSCSRVAWSLGVAWMVVCCCLGYGGVVNYILTWKCWIPLGRLTFTIYLIHPIVQIVAMGNVRTQFQPSHFLAVWIFFGHLCITCGCAFVATMLIEAPFRSLEKVFFSLLGQSTKVNSIATDSSNLKGTLKVGKGKDFAIIIPEVTGNRVREHDEKTVSRL